MNVFEIFYALLSGYVYSREVAQIIALSLIGRRNSILFGPGGHGKSEMVRTILEGISGIKSKTLAFGEGTSMSGLFGGIDLPSLHRGEAIKFHPEQSVWNSDVGVFEEFFDAPVSVLTALKDVLTSKWIRMEGTNFEVVVQSLIGLTNLSPSEVAQESRTVQALVERFPLQLEVHWPKYEAGDFLKMWETTSAISQSVSIDWETIQLLQEEVTECEISMQVKEVLANLISKAIEHGCVISPRTTMHIVHCLKTWAICMGRNYVEFEDLEVLKFFAGCEEIYSDLEQSLKTAKEEASAKSMLEHGEKTKDAAYKIICKSVSPIEILKQVKLLQDLEKSIKGLRVPDGLSQARNNLIGGLQNVISQGKDRALECVRI